MNMFSEGGKTMNRHNKHLKDPGSAITHFIGMLMAIFAAVPQGSQIIFTLSH